MKRGRKVKDLIGNTYGDWTVINSSDKRVNNHVMWLCRCVCGVEKEVNGHDLKNGGSLHCKSCSSKRSYADRLAKGTQPIKPMTHGQSRVGMVTPEYRSYQNAKQRCTNPKVYYYPIYGGRGIKFLFDNFEQFLADIGSRPEPKRMYSLDRIDNDGNYEPGNVRWSTAREQRLNQRIMFLRNTNI